VKPLGPVHAYAAPATADAVRLIFPPEQTGLLLAVTGGAGGVGSMSVIGPAFKEVQLDNVTLIFE
jgi:hypothetical protein